MEPAKKMDDRESEKVGDESQPEAEAVVEPLRGRGRRRNRAAGTDASVNMDELRELIQLVRENEFTEFELEREGFRVRFRRGSEVSEAGAAGGTGSLESATSSGARSAGRETAVSSSVPSHPGAKAQTEASEDQ